MTNGRTNVNELARELFAAGYRQALEDLGRELGLPADCTPIVKLQTRLAMVETNAALRKASGEQPG